MRVVPLEARSQAQCVVCGRGIMPSLNFCPHCGSRQEMEEQPPVSAAHSEAEVTRP
jgi:rRNA maturation endonuclease Nob1